jgi:hypothetical protein
VITPAKVNVYDDPCGTEYKPAGVIVQLVFEVAVMTQFGVGRVGKQLHVAAIV